MSDKTLLDTSGGPNWEMYDVLKQNQSAPGHDKNNNPIPSFVSHFCTAS
jgi:hypothetical protein